MATPAMASPPALRELSAEEMAVYDRQLRVWGVGAQTRMRGAQVLLVGVSMLAGEVAKNLVLAGVGRLTLTDDREFCERSVREHFLLRPAADQGHNRAERLALSLRALNPMVQVDGRLGLRETVQQFLSAEDPAKGRLLVVADSFPGSQLQTWATAARRRGLGFLVAETLGRSGYYLMDFDGLLTERVVPGAAGQPEQLSRIRVCSPSLEELLALPWDRVVRENLFGRRVGHAQSQFFFVQWLLRSRDALGWRQPPDTAEELDAAQLKQQRAQLRAEFVADGSSPEQYLSDQQISHFCEDISKPIHAISSVFGGIVGQEIIKYVSARGAPLLNVMVYDARDGSAVVQPVLASVEALEDGDRMDVVEIDL